MNLFQAKMECLAEEMCKRCHGSGKIDDAEPGDIYFREYICPDCNGTGCKSKEQSKSHENH